MKKLHIHERLVQFLLKQNKRGPKNVKSPHFYHLKIGIKWQPCFPRFQLLFTYISVVLNCFSHLKSMICLQTVNKSENNKNHHLFTL